MTDRAVRRAAVATALAAVLVTGCGGGIAAQPDEFLTPTTIAGAPDAPLVLMVGDSITQFSRAELAATFTGRGWPSATVGHSGTTVAENRGRIKGAVAQSPDVLVVALGTNDALQAASPVDRRSPGDRQDLLEESIDQIDAALDDAESVPCVVWADVNDWTSTPLLRTTGAGETINQALRRQAEGRPKVHVASYADTFRPAAEPAASFLAANFDPEGLHPVSPAARLRFAALVADTVASACKI